MADKVRDIMTTRVVTCDRNDPIHVAARKMRDEAIGDVVITDGKRMCGVLTDRDIVVRALAERKALDTRCGDICTTQVKTIRSDASIDDAVRMMRDNAIRRLPVVEDGDLPTGFVSLGDLAVERDPRSALGEISSAPDNSMRPMHAK